MLGDSPPPGAIDTDSLQLQPFRVWWKKHETKERPKSVYVYCYIIIYLQMCYVYIYISWCNVHQYKILSYICYHLIHLWIESMKQTVWCFWMLLIVTSSITVCALVPVVMPWEETINLASASNCWNSAACLSWRQAGDKLKLDQLVQGVTTCYKMLQHVTTPKKHWVQRYMIIYQNIQDSWAQLQFKTIFEPSGRNLAQTFEDADNNLLRAIQIWDRTVHTK